MTGSVERAMTEAIGHLEAAASAIRYARDESDESRDELERARTMALEAAEEVRLAGRRMVGWES